MTPYLRYYLVLFQMGLAAPLAALPPVADRPADSLAALVDRLVMPQLKPGGPGCAIAVAREGRIIFERAYGLANLDWAIPNTPATRFNIASLSKQFTAACAVLLAEEGKLSLDDDIRTWLPEVRDYGQRITIRNLINHTSGIRDYESLMPIAGMRYDVAWEPSRIFAFIIRQQSLDFPPGEQHAYSNSGYVLLAEIIRRASGQTLGQFARQRIFAPLGMEHTFYGESLYQVVGQRATGYDYDFDHQRYTSGQSDTYTVGPGGIFSTVEDLVLWDRALYGRRIGGPGFLDTMLFRGKLNEGDTLSYACGLEYGTYRGLPTLSHSGWWAGYLAYMVRFPQQQVTVILLANSTSDILPSRNCYKIADLVLGDQFPPDQRPVPEVRAAQAVPPVEVALDPALYDQCVGAYEIGNLDAVLTLSQDGGRLMGQFSGQPRFQLFPTSDSTFFLKIDEVQVCLRRDGQGQVKTVAWRQGGGELLLTRVEPSLSADSLAPYCGDYHSEELQCTWTIVRDGPWLKVQAPLPKPAAPGEDLLLQQQRDWFCLANMQLQFGRAGAGQITGFELTGRNTTWKIGFERR